jgi:hypothetical protein
VDAPVEVRRGVLQRAREAAQERLARNQDRARSIRDGSFYQGGTRPAQGGAPQAASAGQAQSAQTEPRVIELDGRRFRMLGPGHYEEVR